MYMKITYNKNEIEDAVKDSKSYTELLKKFNKPKNGFYVSKFKKIVEEYQCDISHFEKTGKVNCQHCNKLFEVMLHDKSKRKFCSLKCANQKVRGAAIPKKEEDLYGEKKFRLICFRYHEKKCVVCNESNVISVHHYDENHENNDPKNLIPLCPTHHVYMHSKFKHLIDEKVKEYIKNFMGP